MQIKPTPVNERRRQGERAYTLVEIMCAVVITAISASALFVGFNNGFALLRTTREDLRATQILMQKTEAVRMMTWDQLTNLNTIGTFQEYFFPAGSGTNNGGTLFVGSLSTLGVATNIPASVPYKGNLHLITITLQWTNYIGSTAIPHSRQMQTLSALNGMQNYFYGANTVTN